MGLPTNAISIIQGEMTTILTAMRRNARWSHHQNDKDPIIQEFMTLNEMLCNTLDLSEIEIEVFLCPFLELIRFENASAPDTALALSAVNKFLSFEIINPNIPNHIAALENIADSVTHAKFVGIDPVADEVVLMKILMVLKNLVMSPVGLNLSDESICEILQSCLRICWEMRLSELLRRLAEETLKDMIRLLFSLWDRIPVDSKIPSGKKLKMKAGKIDTAKNKKKSKMNKNSKKHHKSAAPATKAGLDVGLSSQPALNSAPNSPLISDGEGTTEEIKSETYITPETLKEYGSVESIVETVDASNNVSIENLNINSDFSAPAEFDLYDDDKQSFTNSQGVCFKPTEEKIECKKVVPFGLPVIRELLRFLISTLSVPGDETIVQTTLGLLTIAFEAGNHHIVQYPSLVSLVKDDLCKNLFSLLNSDKIIIFSNTVHLCFLLFDTLRSHVKFHLEMYLTKLIEIIIPDHSRASYEHKEIALEAIVHLWRLPSFVTELYLNYDCQLYSSNLFEDLTKILSKNAFPVSGLHSIHLQSLKALLTVIDSIESNCHKRILRSGLPHMHNEKSFEVTCVDVIPSHEELMLRKHEKKILATGTEQFNIKPSKGITFLQENAILSKDLVPAEVVQFLRENPRLDKKMIGEYLSNRKNLSVLESFVASFDFTGLRVDESLRLYLEAFRLPGEAPLISMLLEHFADHWHKSNGEPFANSDSAFTLAYAIIMLNVDQHNYNVKKQNNPMTLEEFCKNLVGVNGGQNFDEDLLKEIYHAIRGEEIVMPAEQVGLVRENYLWKVLLKRNASNEGKFLRAPMGIYDHDLFSLIWGPTVAALSYVLDKTNNEVIIQKAISGFKKCAMISAHYEMSDVFDNLAISLCKFTNLMNTTDSLENVAIYFGANYKAQLCAKTMFLLLQRHGDILREGWKNLVEILLQLYRCRLLPNDLIEAEDYLHPDGKICLMKEETPLPKSESSLFSSLYSYISLSPEVNSYKTPNSEDKEYMRVAKECIEDCHPEFIINESKFLRVESLHELVKALICASSGPDVDMMYSEYDEDASIFFLELLVKIMLQNKDRASVVWDPVNHHIYELLIHSSVNHRFRIMERAIVGILRVSAGLMRRGDMTSEVLPLLKMLLALSPNSLQAASRQIAFALHEILRTNATNIDSPDAWSVIFTLLERVGAGAFSKDVGEEERHENGYVSDPGQSHAEIDKPRLPRSESCDLSRASEQETKPSPVVDDGACEVGVKNTIELACIILFHDPRSFARCCETLTFLVRDVVHITPKNIAYCIHCIRTFVEACLLEGLSSHKKLNQDGKAKKSKTAKKEDILRMSLSSPNLFDEGFEENYGEFPGDYHLIAIQLLDLMDTLHTRAADIYSSWGSEGNVYSSDELWINCWCPLLQGIARLCCDYRRQMRTSAGTYLLRALLVHDLQKLNPSQWEDCFYKVLFPLLLKLLDRINPVDPIAVEETRMRAATILSKVFLQHLTPLMTLPTFTKLWVTIIDFMIRYMKCKGVGDVLCEGIPESLKNMLLVMNSAGVFQNPDNGQKLWDLTWDKIGSFLPDLKNHLLEELLKTSVFACNTTSPDVGQNETQPPDVGSNETQPQEEQIAETINQMYPGVPTACAPSIPECPSVNTGDIVAPGGVCRPLDPSSQSFPPPPAFHPPPFSQSSTSDTSNVRIKLFADFKGEQFGYDDKFSGITVTDIDIGASGVPQVPAPPSSSSQGQDSSLYNL